MAITRLQGIHRIHQVFQPVSLSPFYGNYWSHLGATREGITQPNNLAWSYSINNILGVNGPEFTIHLGGIRWMSMMKVPRGAQQVVHTKWLEEDQGRSYFGGISNLMKTAYTIATLRKKKGYSKKLFYQNAVTLYKEINTVMANGDITSLRKIVTEKMYSTLKNDIKRRESVWNQVHWELVEPLVRIRTLRARMIALDKNDLNKAFIQLTVEFLANQRFEAYDSKGSVVAGDKNKEVLVRDIWVFEWSLFHPGSDWRLCARLSP